jgi:hypothetical protein
MQGNLNGNLNHNGNMNHNGVAHASGSNPSGNPPGGLHHNGATVLPQIPQIPAIPSSGCSDSATCNGNDASAVFSDSAAAQPGSAQPGMNLDSSHYTTN